MVMVPLFRASAAAAAAVAMVMMMPGAASARSLCANEHGVYVGMAIDEDSYKTVKGQKAPPPPPPPQGGVGNLRNDDDDINNIEQEWELVDGNKTDLDYFDMDNYFDSNDTKKDSPHNSIAGKYLQVRPIKGRLYPSHGRYLQKVDQLYAESPYVSFGLHVEDHNVGLHTAFLRWAGAKLDGGQDSLFIVMLDGNGQVVAGQRTLRPTMAHIDDTDAGFKGCCFDKETHYCDCVDEVPAGNETCPVFVEVAEAARFGVQCILGSGRMEFVPAPQWYLFAGREIGDATNFESEPWDATCEAEGSNTMDSGSDFSMWNLAQPGDYELRIYAREDGTALDAVYVAGPNGKAPSGIDRYPPGSSTLCPEKKAEKKKKKGGGRWFLHLMFWAAALGGLGYFATRTEPGRALVERAQEYVESLRSGGGSSSFDSSRYEALGMNPP